MRSIIPSCCSFQLVSDQVLPFLNADQLHFSRSWACEGTNDIIAPKRGVLIDLLLNVLRHVPVPRNRKTLLRYAEHSPCANFPNTQSWCAVVNRQFAVDSKALTYQKRMFLT